MAVGVLVMICDLLVGRIEGDQCFSGLVSERNGENIFF